MLPDTRGRRRPAGRLGGHPVAHVAAGLVALAVLRPAAAGAQIHNFRHYTNRDGLPQAQVLAIHQDPVGYLWFGTYGGLGRFNGDEIRILDTEDGLSSNTILDIAGDGTGRLYVGTQGGGLCLVEVESIRCPGEEAGWANRTVTDILVLDDGVVWMATEKGVTRFVDGTFTDFTTEDGLPSNAAEALAYDGEGRLWAGTRNGLARRTADGFEAVQEIELSGRTVEALLPLPGGLVVGTDRSLHMLSAEGLVERVVPDLPGEASFLDAAASSSGGAWIATDRGLLRYANGEFELLTRENGLATNMLTRVAEDREGNVWIGTEQGLSKLVPGPFLAYTTAEGLPHPFVRALAEDGEGRLWVGTRAGLAVRTGDAFRTVLPASELPNPRIYALAPIEGGDLLVGTREGLHRVREGRIVRSFYTTDGLPSDYVLALESDGEGNVWVGTEAGLLRWRENELLPLPPSDPLSDAFVVSLRRDAADRLWVGLRSGGVRILSEDDTLSLSEDSGLTDQTVWSLDLDDEGRMWVGTNGDGLFRVNGGDIRRWSTEDGLVNDFVWQVLVDSRGSLWAYTNRGLDRYRNGAFTHYGIGDGLTDLEGSANAALESSAGQLWFGTSSGLLAYRPDLDLTNLVAPPVVIEEVTVDGAVLAGGGEINPDAELLRLHFTSLTFRDPAAVRYSYRLQRTQAAETSPWSSPTADETVTFANLGPGSYTFEVIAINDDGVNSEDPATFAFTVLPAFWQTWWFWLLGGVGLLGGVAAVPALRARRLAAERERLEARVEERTEELETANDRLRNEIRERERFEEALRASEARLREVVENSTNVFYSHTPDNRLTYISPQIHDLLGLDPEEAMIPWPQLLTDHPANEVAYDRTERAIETGERQAPYELQLRHRDGHAVWVRVTEAPVVRGGETVAVVGSLTDITEAREAEEERQRLEEQLRHAQKMEAVGRLAGGVAHDFNNLLTSIVGHTDIVAEELGEDHEVLPELREVRKASERAAGLVQQLLAFGRKQVVEPRVLRLAEVVAGATNMLRRVLKEDIELVTDDGGEDPKVRMDRGQLEQILVNLAVNASDAMPSGGRLTISTSARFVERLPADREVDFVPGRFAVLEVSDTGHGMDAATREHIFEPFFTTKDVGKGTGLGLATVYGIVKQNAGYVFVDSEPGEGATFTVFLPESRGPVGTEGSEEPTSETGTGHGTILVVEDEDAVRRLVTRVLGRQGYQVLEACDGRTALEIFEELDRPVDLLLTDMIMPGTTGKALAETIRQRHGPTRVLFMSGYADEVLGEKGVLSPGIDLLQKPFDSETLLERVQEIMDS